MTVAASMATLANGIRLSYAATGSRPSPAVVMLPGPTDSWRSYQPVLDALPSSLRAIAVSQRGHGDSDKPSSGYRVVDFAADVVQFLDELGIARAVLVAHSGSCMVARRVAIDDAARVAGLVLEASPTTLKEDPGLEEFVGSVVSTMRDPIDPAFARSFVVATSSFGLAPDLVDGIVADLLQVPARVWKEVFAGLLGYDDRSELSRITAPTLLIWGDADELVGRDHQDSLARLIGDVELRAYEGVGHTPRWEQPERFGRDIADFVSRSSGS
jgi:pimeloyl-ACP methyl ester carboxylesterase